MKYSGKLELTWVNKEKEFNVEPRILIEDKVNSYGDPNTKNMLIHGDNLVALKALERDFAGKIKCVYIDPPFNTGAAFDYYDDNVEHSIWLDLMYRRLKILHTLIAEDGVILIELDDNEMPYLRVILDEIFGRNKFVAQINVKSNSISGTKTANKYKTILRNKDNIIVYKKGDTIALEPQYTIKDFWDTHYSSFLVNENNQIVRKPLKDVLVENKIIAADSAIRSDALKNTKFKEFVIKNANLIHQTVGSIKPDKKQESLNNPDKIISWSEDDEVYYAYNGRRISFLSKTIKLIDGKPEFVQLLGDLWTDIDFQNTQNEGGISFPASKKPEALIRRILDMFTKPNDFVLDSFLGSGTTAAVAHKMNRQWIGIEMGDHAYTHCKKRLDLVIDGKDKSGVTELVKWQGGGGYKFYELAEPLLVKNPLIPVYDINPNYTFEMVCEAICKIEAFTYAPADFYHGYSTENRFIHVTFDFVNGEYVSELESKLSSKQSLIIYCLKYQKDITLPDNIEIRRIPKDIQSKYNFESEGK